MFSPISIDIFDLGRYWVDLREKYPRKELHPAIQDNAGFALGVPALRGLFVSDDDAKVLQLQKDRMYVNWRKRHAEYPRFSSGEGALKPTAIAELDAFAKFCQYELGQQIRPHQVELAKIDMIEKGRYWDSFDELRQLLPITDSFEEFRKTEQPEFAIKFSESGPQFTTTLNFATARAQKGELAAVKVETRVSVHITDLGIESAFSAANERSNEAFFTMFKQEKLEGR